MLPPMTEKTPQLRLEWRHTWTNKDQDYCAKDPQDSSPGENCRVYLCSSSGNPRWRWYASSRQGNLGQGWEETAKAAAVAAEAAYWARPTPKER